MTNQDDQQQQPKAASGRLTRAAVAVLGGIAATFAVLVGAVSLTRIAGDYLGFPPGLEWTFTGAVDVAGIAGGIMWTAFKGEVRKIGRPMNIVCTAVSGIGVGLDHLTHAGRALRETGSEPALPGSSDVWPWVAFTAGLFVPALATWILHALSIIADTATQDVAGDHQEAGDRQASVVASPAATPGERQAGAIVVTTQPDGALAIASPDRQPASPAPLAKSPAQDRQPPGEIARPAPGDRQADRQASTASSAGDRQPGSPARPAATKPAPPEAARPTRALHALPGGRQKWMTDALIHDVVAAIRDAEAKTPPQPYGRSQIADNHHLTTAKARALLAFIKDNDLLRESA